MNIFDRLTNFVTRVFKTNLEIFLTALKLSPNAQGYVSGSVTELLLKQKLENELGFEVKRIREKWEGRKHPNHHGDFYIREEGSENWFVIESKGVKSNSEKWHKLYNHENLKRFLISNEDKIYFIDHSLPIEPQIDTWISTNLPLFVSEYSQPLYEYEEIQKYIANLPSRESTKLRAILGLQHYSREEIENMIQERLTYLFSKVKVLETHFVSGKSASGNRTQATPRKDEFNIMSIDIVLRYPEHKFLFANPNHLESSEDDVNHLQQNYIVGFCFTEDNGNTYLSLSTEWYEDFLEVFSTIDPQSKINTTDMRIDNRFDLLEQDYDESLIDPENEK